MINIATIIRKHLDEIVRLWTEESSQAASARGLTKPQFENLMPIFLSELAAAGDFIQPANSGGRFSQAF